MIHHVKGNFKPFSNPQTELKNNKKQSDQDIEQLPLMKFGLV